MIFSSRVSSFATFAKNIFIQKGMVEKMNSEFLQALTEIEKEKNISKDILFDAIDAALVSAYKRNYNTNQNNVIVNIDRENGQVKVFVSKEVVESVEEVEPVEEEPTEEVEEEEPEEEPVAEKGESKAEPVHDNLQAEKAKKINIYEFMGKNPDGTRKH